MTNVETPIQITAYYTGIPKEDTAQPVTEHTPKFHDITIENLAATGAKYAAVIMGLPEAPIKNLVLRNISITAQNGLRAQNAQITESNVSITAAAGDPAIYGPNVTIIKK